MIISGHDTEVIGENIARVRGELERAAEMSPTGRVPKLVAATKTVPAEVIAYVAENFGLDCIGENRVQELLEKNDMLPSFVERHLIGSLQTNKVKYIVDKVSMIHSVDSVKLAREIGRRSAAIGKTMDVTVEVNIGREASKSGFLPDMAVEAALEIAEIDGLCVRGIMTMAPKCEKSDDYRKYFSKTYNIFIDFLTKKHHNIIEPVLSMGMSGSYREAALEGATHVRVGTALFGARSYPPVSKTILSEDKQDGIHG